MEAGNGIKDNRCPCRGWRNDICGNHNGEVYAISLNSGEVKWKYQCDGSILGPVSTDDKKVYVGTFAGNVYALDKSPALSFGMLR